MRDLLQEIERGLDKAEIETSILSYGDYKNIETSQFNVSGEMIGWILYGYLETSGVIHDFSTSRANTGIGIGKMLVAYALGKLDDMGIIDIRARTSRKEGLSAEGNWEDISIHRKLLEKFGLTADPNSGILWEHRGKIDTGLVLSNFNHGLEKYLNSSLTGI